MYSAFLKLLNMSAASGIVILAVILLRLILRKAPKKYICLLWAIAALRLIVPVSITSSLSAYNYVGTPVQPAGQMEFIRYDGQNEPAAGQLPVFRFTDSSREAAVQQPRKAQFYLPAAMGIWAVGVAAMLGYAAYSCRKVHQQTGAALRIRGNVYICDYIPSPFILGMVRPKIYLPSGLTTEQMQCVTAHEQAHIRRLDHWWKPLGFLLLSFHWFNPLVWVGYALLSRDIEAACDERVIENMNTKQKQNYSETLLQCAVPQKMISACPLAFGETGVKQRVKGVLNYRKPTAWLAALSMVICLCAATAFLTDPVQAENSANMAATETLPEAEAAEASYLTADDPAEAVVTPETGSTVYSSPSTKAHKIGVISGQEKFTVRKEENIAGVRWGYGSTEDQMMVGWVNLEESPNVQEDFAGLGVVFGIVTTVNNVPVNVRSDAGFNYPAVNILQSGAAVQILEIVDAGGTRWARIGENQWVAMAYITMIDGTPGDGVAAAAAREYLTCGICGGAVERMLESSEVTEETHQYVTGTLGHEEEHTCTVLVTTNTDQYVCKSCKNNLARYTYVVGMEHQNCGAPEAFFENHH